MTPAQATAGTATPKSDSQAINRVVTRRERKPGSGFPLSSDSEISRDVRGYCEVGSNQTTPIELIPPATGTPFSLVCSLLLDKVGILRGVSLLPRKHLLLCVFAWMLVVLRITDAHAHLCFDGNEPPATIHVADLGSHPCESDPVADHSGDRDIQPAADILLKKAAFDVFWLPSAAIPQAAIVVQPYDEVILPAYQPAPAGPAVYFLPPLRGPPVQSSLNH